VNGTEHALPDITTPAGVLAMAEQFAATARQLVAAEATIAEQGRELGRVVPVSAPTRPGDISHTVPLRDLADGYQDHLLPLVEHRHGISEPLTPEQLGEHALAALAYQHALSERALHSRWSIATDALAAGAPFEVVGAAMGGRGAGRGVGVPTQRQAGLMSDERSGQVLGLLADRTELKS
jgi:hypothetical protein